jgi:hypothetical protein
MNTNMGSPRNTLNYTVTCSATKLFCLCNRLSGNLLGCSIIIFLTSWVVVETQKHAHSLIGQNPCWHCETQRDRDHTNMGSPRNTLNYTVTCSATKLFAAIQGMNTWCQSKCNLKQVGSARKEFSGRANLWNIVCWSNIHTNSYTAFWRKYFSATRDINWWSYFWVDMPMVMNMRMFLCFNYDPWR